MIEGKDNLIFEDQDHKRRYEEDSGQFTMCNLIFSEDMKEIVGGFREDTGEKLGYFTLLDFGIKLGKPVNWEKVEENYKK